MGAYVFDNSWEKERVRLAGLESMLDPGTRRHLDAVGVGAGWTCLEVGGGGGAIVQWLCRRVGSAGEGIAPDLDTRVLHALGKAGYGPEYGFRLPGELVAMGLEEVGGEMRAPILPGGSPGSAAHRFTLEHLRAQLLASGELSEEELDREIAGLNDPETLCSL